jgi:hypothetical protein
MSQLSHDQICYFKHNGVLYLNNLFTPSLCEAARLFFSRNESKLITEYSSNPRGLVTETVGNTEYIKYFEYPLQCNSFLFGRFLSSELFNIGTQLLESPIRYVSAEIHSRFAGASEIPMHQDNAYYGLADGKALTFYIALDKQLPTSGGLKYLSNPVTDEYQHLPCDSTAFSLTIEQPDLLRGRKLIQPIYEPGDCTIHHSRSVHFADSAPSNSSRSIVFRISVYSVDERKKPGHDEWYQDIIMKNRAKS